MNRGSNNEIQPGASDGASRRETTSDFDASFSSDRGSNNRVMLKPGRFTEVYIPECI